MDRDEKFEHLFDDDDEFKTEPGDFHFDEDIKFEEPAEYQFADDVEVDDVVVANAVADDKPGLFEKLNQINFKKIVIYLFAAILLIAFIGASLKTLLSNKPEEAAPAQMSSSIVPSDNTASLEIEQETKSKGQIAVDVELAKQLKQLSEQNATLANRVQVLESQLGQTATQLATYQQQAAKSQSDAAGLTKTIAQLEDQMTQINNALQMLVTASKSPTVPVTSTGSTLPPARSYIVQAIIPGRAWLKANNGQIITVSLGDLIPGFGRVTLIDPQNGFVQTDAGLTVNYAIDQG